MVAKEKGREHTLGASSRRTLTEGEDLLPSDLSQAEHKICRLQDSGEVKLTQVSNCLRKEMLSLLCLQK